MFTLPRAPRSASLSAISNPTPAHGTVPGTGLLNGPLIFFTNPRTRTQARVAEVRSSIVVVLAALGVVDFQLDSVTGSALSCTSYSLAPPRSEEHTSELQS